MITPVGTIPAAHERTESPPAPQPQRQTIKSGTLSQDQVTLKSAGEVESDHDGD